MKLLKVIHSLRTWPHTNSAVKPEVHKSFLFFVFNTDICQQIVKFNQSKKKKTKAQFQLQNIFDFKLLLFLFVLQKSSEEMWNIVSFEQLVWQYDYEHNTIHEKNYDTSLAALLVVTVGHQSLVGLSGQGLI